MGKPALEQVLRGHAGKLMLIPGVVGVGEADCDGAPCIKVMTASLTSENARLIPSEIEGYKVQIEKTGEIRAL